MDTLHIKPRDGVTVRDPRTARALKKSGEKKPRNTYWLRRLRDGDVIDLDAKTEARAPKPPAKTDGGKS